MEDGESKQETLTRLKVCCDEKLLGDLGLDKSLRALKRKKVQEVQAIKNKFFERADPSAVKLFPILNAKALQDTDYPRKVTLDAAVTIQSLVRGFLVRLDLLRTNNASFRSSSQALAPYTSPGTMSLEHIDSLMARFPQHAMPQVQHLADIELDPDEIDAEYLLKKLDERAARLRRTLMSLCSVYKTQVHVYKEYQHTYAAITG